MKNSGLGTKFLMTVVTLALLAYFGIQGWRYFNDPLSTTLAYTYQVEESISLSGYVVRQEQVLSPESGGLLRLQRGEGDRVSAGGTVATVYADQASLDRQAEIDTLTGRIEQLEYVQETELGIEVVRKLDEQIQQNIIDYRTALTAERFYDAERQGAELRAQVMKRDYSESDTGDLALRLEELQAQRKTLQSQAAGSVRRITVPDSGLYSAVVDGYESILTPTALETMRPSTLLSAKPDEQAMSNVGKLVQGRYWYYAVVMSAEAAKELEKAAETLSAQGDTLLLRFAKGVERDLPVTLDTVGEEEDGRCVVVFRGSTYLSQLTLLREQSAQIIYRTETGIRVPREALRIRTETVADENGEETEVQATGVYCIIGTEAYFKPVEVLLSEANFALVQADNPSGETMRIRPGDEVIVSARDLYHGKVVR